MVKACASSQQSQPSPAVGPLNPWQWSIDYAGPTDGKMFLVVVDAHSMWIDVFPMSN
jgi:hypothetical protein